MNNTQNIGCSNGREYGAIDIAKFVGALLVMSIHIPLFSNANGMVCANLNWIIGDFISRIAVPFYFCFTGFLLFGGEKQHRKEKNVQYVLKILRLYFIWLAIYFPIAIHCIFGNEKGIFAGLLTWVKNVIFIGGDTLLWYLPAVAFAVFVLSFLMQRGIKIEILLSVSFLLYIFGTLSQSWYGFLQNVVGNESAVICIYRFLFEQIGTLRNGLFEGCFFVAIGICYADKQKNAKRLTKEWLFVLLLISCLVYFAEYLFLRVHNYMGAYDLYLGLAPIIFFGFPFLVSFQCKNNTRMIRSVSSLIYFFHVWIDYAMQRMCSLLNFDFANCILRFWIVLIITTIVSCLIVILSKTEKYKFLKYLYS